MTFCVDDRENGGDKICVSWGKMVESLTQNKVCFLFWVTKEAISYREKQVFRFFKLSLWLLSQECIAEELVAKKKKKS